MQYFSQNGTFLIGQHKEKHYTELPKSYVEWAKENLKAFTMEFEWLTANKTAKPLVSRERWKSSCGNGTIANKGLRSPKPNRFQSRAKRTPGATLH